MNDQPPPNLPRVLIDGQLEVRPGQTVPVLAQPTTHRMIVLNSGVMDTFEIGQRLVLHLPDQPPQFIAVESLDKLSLITRYIPAPADPDDRTLIHE